MKLNYEFPVLFYELYLIMILINWPYLITGRPSCISDDGRKSTRLNL